MGAMFDHFNHILHACILKTRVEIRKMEILRFEIKVNAISNFTKNN